jgi:CHAT domain-containing protein
LRRRAASAGGFLFWTLQVFGACPTLEPGHALTLAIRQGEAVCIEVRVPVGQSAQLSVTQPVNLRLSVPSPVDAFEFGPETVTWPGGGLQIVRIEGNSAVDNRVWHVRATLRTVSATIATRFAEAERSSSLATQTRAEANIRVSLAQWETLGERLSVARSHLKLGDFAYRLSRDRLAVESYDAALSICVRLKDDRCIAEAANNSGLTAQRLGEMRRSRARLEQAQRAWRTVNNPVLAALTLSNIGLNLYYTGELGKALVTLGQARVALAGRDAVAHARVLNNLALCYTQLGEYRIARTYYKQAIAAYDRNRIAASSVISRANLGRNYLQEGNIVQAEQTVREAARDARVLPNPAPLGQALTTLGEILIGRGRELEAEPLLVEGAEIARRSGSRRGYASNLHYLALVASKKKDVERALSLLNEAIQVRAAIGAAEAEGESWFELAQIEYFAGRKAAARTHLERALTLGEATRRKVPGGSLRASYFARKRRWFDLLVDLSAESGSPTDALLAAERGRSRALLDSLAEASVLHVPKPLLEAQQELQGRIDTLTLQLSEATGAAAEALRDALDPLLAQTAELDAQVQESLAEERFGGPMATVADVRRLPLHGRVLLEYHLGERFSYLWTLTESGVRMHRLPRRDEVERRIAPTLQGFAQFRRRQASTRLQSEFERGMEALSSLLLGPIEQGLLQQEWIIVSDGLLQNVPWAALRSPGGNPLGLERDLMESPSSSFLLKASQPRPKELFPKTVLAIFDPIFNRDDPRLANLPASKLPNFPKLELARIPYHDEVGVLRKLVLPARREVLSGTAATPDAFYRRHPENFAFLHFATHALVDPAQPALSRIVLSASDGTRALREPFLRPTQLGNLALEAPIVVLAACKSATGKPLAGEGMLGFTLSLFQAGAAQIVASGIDLDAAASAAFLSRFYKEVLVEDAPTTEHAVRLARMEMSSSKRWADPYFWATFAIHGRPTRR